MAPLLLVDAASLYFRAFHGVPLTAAATRDGRPVNAVRGFLDMLATLIATRRPDRMVCALDADWRPAWRVALVPSYKAHRVAVAAAPGTTSEPVAGPDPAAGSEIVPDALTPQVPMILDALEMVGIAAIGVDGHEADDVIGTLAAREPGPIEVVTGDRDLIQVIDDAREVRVLYCGRGVSRLEVLDDAAVAARYGVPAARYPDLATLRGDPSDGLPGVAGVGERTAASLVARFGALPGVLAAAADPSAPIAPATRARLLAARDSLVAARLVTEVRQDVPIDAVDARLPAAPTHPERLAEAVERWNIAGPAARLTAALAGASGPALV